MTLWKSALELKAAGPSASTIAKLFMMYNLIGGLGVYASKSRGASILRSLNYCEHGTGLRHKHAKYIVEPLC